MTNEFNDEPELEDEEAPEEESEETTEEEPEIEEEAEDSDEDPDKPAPRSRPFAKAVADLRDEFKALEDAFLKLDGRVGVLEKRMDETVLHVKRLRDWRDDADVSHLQSDIRRLRQDLTKHRFEERHP